MVHSKNKLKLSDLHYMKEALKLAQEALKLGEWPVGALIICDKYVCTESQDEKPNTDQSNIANKNLDSKILAKAHNMVESLNDPTAHAELIAARQAFNILNSNTNINTNQNNINNNIRNTNSRYLENCTLFVTLEPCKMCLYTLQTMRIGKIIYGAKATNALDENKLIMFDTICEEESQKLILEHASIVRSKHYCKSL